MRLIAINSTQYKGQHMLKSISIMSLALLFSSTVIAQTQDNKLTKEEHATGWQLLFNGKDMSHWRNFKVMSLAQNGK